MAAMRGMGQPANPSSSYPVGDQRNLQPAIRSKTHRGELECRQSAPADVSPTKADRRDVSDVSVTVHSVFGDNSGADDGSSEEEVFLKRPIRGFAHGQWTARHNFEERRRNAVSRVYENLMRHSVTSANGNMQDVDTSVTEGFPGIDLVIEEPSFWTVLNEGVCAFVKSAQFDYISISLVVANALALGIQVDWQARQMASIVPFVFRAIELVFCGLFTVEVILRMYVHGREFWGQKDMMWNVFDVLMVAAQLVEEVLVLVLDSSDSFNSGSNTTILRTLRILRLVRVMRVMRVFHLVLELRTLVMSILNSFKTLAWAMLLLLIAMYVVGVYFTQIVLEHRLSNPASTSEHAQALSNHWGSLGDAILILYQSVTGGLDWADVMTPLKDDISVFMVPLFMIYTAFICWCLVNVIAGVFVEAVLSHASSDKDAYIVSHVRKLFLEADGEDHGFVTWKEFSRICETDEMQVVFKQIDMAMTEAENLFKLLDVNQNGQIDVDEFIAGITHLRGPAKALDLTLLMRMTERVADRQIKQAKIFEQYLKAQGHDPILRRDGTEHERS